jgi:hypothetical protein
MKMSVFWDIMPYSPVKVNLLEKNIFLGRRLYQFRNQHEEGSKKRLTFTGVRHVSEDRNLHCHDCENLRSNTTEYSRTLRRPQVGRLSFVCVCTMQHSITTARCTNLITVIERDSQEHILSWYATENTRTIICYNFTVTIVNLYGNHIC